MADEEKKDAPEVEATPEAQEETKEDLLAGDAGAPAAEEKKEEAPKEEEGDEFDMSSVSPDQKKFIETVEKMTVLELHELVKVLEKRFGVSAVAAAAASAGAAGGDAGEEKDSFDVELADGGAQKIQVIKAVKEVLGLGLKEAKDMVDGVPTMLKQGVKKAEAEELKAKIEEAGGKVELK